VLIASNYGRAGNPAWFENLVAGPHVKVIRRGRALSYTARVAVDDERRNLLRRTDDVTYGVYAAYARKTEREIPVVVLTPDA
jgi:deazaflavin-dependent oxidoreductase (nitroreductase family)